MTIEMPAAAASRPCTMPSLRFRRGLPCSRLIESAGSSVVAMVRATLPFGTVPKKGRTARSVRPFGRYFGDQADADPQAERVASMRSVGRAM